MMLNVQDISNTPLKIIMVVLSCGVLAILKSRKR